MCCHIVTLSHCVQVEGGGDPDDLEELEDAQSLANGKRYELDNVQLKDASCNGTLPRVEYLWRGRPSRNR